MNPRQLQAAGKWLDLFAAMWANYEVNRLPDCWYIKPFAYFVIADPPETSDDSWS
jgi:hypothetical protein